MGGVVLKCRLGVVIVGDAVSNAAEDLKGFCTAVVRDSRLAIFCNRSGALMSWSGTIAAMM